MNIIIGSKESVEYLIKTVGADRCIFGTETPGVASVIDPRTGRQMDDMVSAVRDADFLTDEEKTAIFEINAKKVFKL